MIYPWCEQPYQKLFARWQAGSLPHALLFYGQKGCGKYALAKTLAGRVLCESTDESLQLPCGHCRSCQLQHAATHPDLLVIEGDEGTISVEQVRVITQWVQLRARSREKVVLIKCAEQMTPSASNALLKVLEEPPSDTRFLLCSDRFSALLPTIVSRCQLWRVDVTRDAAQHYLCGLGYALAPVKVALQLFDGSPLAAQNWLQQEGEKADYSRLPSMLLDWCDGRLTTAELVEFLIEAPRWLMLLFADTVKYQAGVTTAGLFSDKQLAALSRRFTNEVLFSFIHQWNKLLALKTVNSGINMVLQMTALLVSLKLPQSGGEVVAE